MSANQPSKKWAMDASSPFDSYLVRTIRTPSIWSFRIHIKKVCSMKRRGLLRRKRCIACESAVTNYMVDISKDVDREKFEKLMAVNKEITLAFAFKDTGSMAIEIMVTEPSEKRQK